MAIMVTKTPPGGCAEVAPLDTSPTQVFITNNPTRTANPLCRLDLG